MYRDLGKLKIFIFLVLLLVTAGCNDNNAEIYNSNELKDKDNVRTEEPVSMDVKENNFPDLGSDIDPDIIDYLGRERWIQANSGLVNFGLKQLKVFTLPLNDSMISIYTFLDIPNRFNWIEWMTSSKMTVEEQMALPYQVMPEDSKHKATFVERCSDNTIEICHISSFFTSSIGDIFIDVTTSINKVRVSLDPVGSLDYTIANFSQNKRKVIVDDYSYESLQELTGMLEKNQDLKDKDTSVVNDGSGISTYNDEEYGFSFDYPAEWVGQIDFQHSARYSDAKTSIDVIYVKESLQEYVFSIVVYDEEVSEQEWENPMMQYIATHNGKTFALATVPEPSMELLEPENQDTLQYMQEMVQKLDIVKQTFRFD